MKRQPPNNEVSRATAVAERVIPAFVVLPPRTLLLDVAGPVEVLRRANMEQGRVRFDLRYVGATASIRSSIGLMLADIEPLPGALPDGAMIVVSGSVDEVAGVPDAVAPDAERDQEAAIVDWLRGAVRPGQTLVSICSGALLAGRAGLLDGRECTTHYACIAQLATLAPSAKVLENRLYVEDGDRFTSAGVTAGIDLMLHLVATIVGPACALAVARHLVVYLRRSGADPQLSPWLEGRNHIHPAVHLVQDAVAADPARDWTLEALAAIAGSSERHLSRLFNDHASMSISDYTNRLRVSLARELLDHTRLDMESVAERAGFGSTRQLRRVWRKFHATPPRAARSETLATAADRS